jgi:hypothetical protein
MSVVPRAQMQREREETRDMLNSETKMIQVNISILKTFKRP